VITSRWVAGCAVPMARAAMVKAAATPDRNDDLHTKSRPHGT
jgi:hypothetical protein